MSIQNDAKKPEKMAETLAHRYSSDSSQRELSSEYQHDRVLMVFKNLCILALWTKVASALEELKVRQGSDDVALFVVPLNAAR